MIDWAQVSQLRDEIGDEGFAEIAAAFLAEIEEILDDLHSGRIAAERMEGTFHVLKGSALNLGLSDFAGICAQAEISARTGQPMPDPDWLVGVFRVGQDAFLKEMGARFFV
ncbi:histidine kinase [Roseivivax halodurans JCM 10272]|uniref:Histidine kinase n=1 Tax=Roseivivax halodurans JCM 10272 TaxID=1449350 RepID=X7EGH7_9RHOB|nr:Hpt domain-containing protein [Roseivivax halodurans]ETX15022.1 histidine kinase [Roseivivax halodurans JCM 10272]